MHQEPHRPIRILVTGGAGFIGSAFVERLLRSGGAERIVVLDLLTYAGSLDNLAGSERHAGYRFVQGDISDRPLIERLLREHQIDTIVHFAAESHVDRSIDGPLAFVRTNVVGTAVLLECARLYWKESPAGLAASHRFHHISTDEVFGTLGRQDPAFSETTPYAPNSPYSASKAGADHLARAWRHTFRFPVVTTNCSNNYGPRQHHEKFIPTIIGACWRREPIPVYGDGSNRRDWLFVEDHCEAIECVLRRGRLGETYNVGGACEVDNLSIAKQVCALMDEARPEGGPHERLITFVTDRPGHDWRYAIDFTKLERELGWRPQHDFAGALRKTVAWYLGNDAWRRHADGRAPIAPRLGLDPQVAARKEADR